MTGIRTFYGNIPTSYRRWWAENVYPVEAAKLLDGGDDGGGILEPLAERRDQDLQRLLDFGPCWGWWNVPEDQRQGWRAIG